MVFQTQFDRRAKIVEYYTERVTQLLTSNTEKWKISEVIVFDAFMEFRDGFLDDAHEICLWGLHNDLVPMSAYHAGCLHAILSTWPLDCHTHAHQAYRLVATDFSIGVDNFKNWSTSFAYLSQVSWGLSTFAVKKQWESMMRQHLQLEWSMNDKEEAVPKAERLKHENRMQKYEALAGLLNLSNIDAPSSTTRHVVPEDDKATLRSSRSFPKPKGQSNVAVALDNFETFEALERALQEKDDRTLTQSIFEQEGISNDSNSTVPHNDQSSESPAKLNQDADDSEGSRKQNDHTKHVVAPSDTRVYQDNESEYHIVDLEEYNRQVAAAALVELKSQSTTPNKAEASQSGRVREDIPSVVPSSFAKVAGCSPHPEKPDVLPSASVHSAAPSLAVDVGVCGQTSPPKDDTCGHTNDSSEASLDSRSHTPPPEDHTASDFKSENSEVDSDVESEVWDAMYNDGYLDRAKERLDSWKTRMIAVKGDTPELFDQIIYFLRTLRNLWQSGQPDCSEIVVDQRLRKLWKAMHSNSRKDYDEKLRIAAKLKRSR